MPVLPQETKQESNPDSHFLPGSLPPCLCHDSKHLSPTDSVEAALLVQSCSPASRNLEVEMPSRERVHDPGGRKSVNVIELHVGQPAPCLLSPKEFSMKHAAPAVNFVKVDREWNISSPMAYSEIPGPVFAHVCLLCLF